MFLHFLHSKNHIPWRLFLKDRFISISAGIGVFLNVVLWLLLVWKMPHQALLPLHYNIYFGFDRFGPWYAIFIVPLLGSVALLLHFFVAHMFYKEDLFLARSLMLTGAVLEIIMFTAGVVALLLNI